MKHTLQEHFETAAALLADTPVEGFKMLMAESNAEYVQQRDSFLQIQLKDKNLVKEIVSSLLAEKTNDAQTDFLVGEAYGFSGRPQHAFDSYIKAAGNGYAPAKVALAHQLINGMKDQHGEAVIANPEMAVAWLTDAADQNYAPAQQMLGKLHRDGVKNTEGKVIVAADPAQALDWFRKAADQGSSEAKNSAEAIHYPEVLKLIKTKLLDDPRVKKIFAHDGSSQANVQISQALKEVLNPQEGHSAEPSSAWAQKHRKNNSPLPELRTTEAHDKPLTELIIKSLEKRSASKSVSEMAKEGIEDYLRSIKPLRNADISAVGVLTASPARGFAHRVKAIRSLSPRYTPSPIHSELSDYEQVQLPSPSHSDAAISPKSAAARTPSPSNSDTSTVSGDWQMVVRGAAGGKGNARS